LMDASTAYQRNRTYGNLAHAFSEAEPGLEQEFTRLFLGPGRPVAHPFESVYREGRMMGDTTLDVQRRLASEGLTPDARTLPDHVSIELAFMAHLAACEARAWEDGDGDGARDYLARQESFLYDHLLRWLPQFCHRTLAGRPLGHYANLARETEAFVAGDAVRVRAWLGNGTGESVGVADRPERWVVTVNQGCTLCGICTQVCRPGALKQVRHTGRRMVVLRVDAVLCDGCAACQRWCPEEIIAVNRFPDGEHPSENELARSAMLACPGCGQLHAPAAMVAKVQAQVDQGRDALLQRLALCPECKATDLPLRRSNGVQASGPEPSAGTQVEGLSGGEPLSHGRSR
jgi:TorA maturation chaperone TorD/Pyruvate/2-oxoacid:ferredoxin oxidoreductase delta subunit